MYFADTNICIYYLNGTYESIVDYFRRISPKDIKISAIVKQVTNFAKKLYC